MAGLTAGTILLLLLTSYDGMSSASEMQLGIPRSNSAAGPRIVGGRPAREKEFPYQVQLILGNSLCGGTIIDHNHILTAAHCVFKNNKLISVKEVTAYVGNIYYSRGDTYQANKITAHESYDKDTVKNDIAVIRVTKNFTFTDAVRSITRQSASPIISERNGTTQCVVSGWGVRYEDSSSVSSILMAANVSLVPKQNCSSTYGSKPSDFDGMLCAREEGNDACQGDSGGPLVCNNMLTGVVSWGYGCAYKNYPGVYTDVYHHRSWINKHSSANCILMNMNTVILAIFITAWTMIY